MSLPARPLRTKTRHRARRPSDQRLPRHALPRRLPAQPWHRLRAGLPRLHGLRRGARPGRHSSKSNRTQRRIWARNLDLQVEEVPARATQEQYALFRSYQLARHSGGEMARMDFCDYQTLVEDTPVDTLINEVRGARRHAGRRLPHRPHGRRLLRRLQLLRYQRRATQPGQLHDPLADPARPRSSIFPTSTSASGSPTAPRCPTSPASGRSRLTHRRAGRFWTGRTP